MNSQVLRLINGGNFVLALHQNLITALRKNIPVEFGPAIGNDLMNNIMVENIHERNEILSMLGGDIIVMKSDMQLIFANITTSNLSLVCKAEDIIETGLYTVEMMAYSYTNNLYMGHNISLEINVYREIFETSSIAFVTGLCLGFIFAFIALIFFCIQFYKMKNKYQLLLQEESYKNQRLTDLQIEQIEE